MPSIVPVYSIGKSYTAIALLRSLDPERQVGDVVPGLPEPLRPLTLLDLLSHRSGLDDYYPWPDYRAAVEARETPWPAGSILARAEVGAPGSFRYSNIGYLLLRLALEEHHQGSFFEVLDELVLQPLEIHAHPFAELADWARCDHPGIDDRLRAYHPGWVYTGTFAADPLEAARGLALVMQGALGADLAARLQQTWKVQVPPDHPMGPDAGYGLGMMTSGDPTSVLGHGGQGPGLNLFAATSADGSRWHGEVQASEGEDLELVRRCVTRARA